MKPYTIFFKKLLPSLMLILFSVVTIKAQDKQDKYKAIRNAVESKNYVFVAQLAQTTSGRLRQLTSRYQLEVKTDTINADLPYFGRAYSLPIDPSKVGINFTSTDFEYSNTPKKNGGWSVLIKPKEKVDARQLILDISQGGYANLRVISNNRQSISFNGYVQETRSK